MKRVVLGPTFEVGVSEGSGAASDRLAGGLEKAGEAVKVRRSGTHFLVTVGADQRHFWSPWMTFEFVDSEGGARGHGRFNPSPAIWTGVMLAGIALLTLVIAGVVWACADWMLDRPMVGLWVSAGSVVGILGLYAVSALGQRLAHAQMEEIEGLVRGVVGDDG